jgi:hypothetical protein
MHIGKGRTNSCCVKERTAGESFVKQSYGKAHRKGGRMVGNDQSERANRDKRQRRHKHERAQQKFSQKLVQEEEPNQSFNAIVKQSLEIVGNRQGRRDKWSALLPPRPPAPRSDSYGR